METRGGLKHLFVTVFLHFFSSFMVIPAITDVTMSALCPGKDECSLAIYLTGIQNAVVGFGTFVMMPLIGNLSDTYGRKTLLTAPLTLYVLPLAILACNRTISFFYAYYALKTLVNMVCEGTVHCLALAYVTDNVPETRRASVFGMLSGIISCAFVCGNLSTRFLSTSSTFQVSAAVALLAVLYMRIFLPESTKGDYLSLQTCLIEEGEEQPVLKGDSISGNKQLFKRLSSLTDLISLLRSSSTFSQAAIVIFFTQLGDVGLHTTMTYYLKARFHFNKNQFADLMAISGFVASFDAFSVPVVGEEKLLSIGLFFNCAHMFLYSIAWSSWVPYTAAMFSILIVFSHPCLRSIASKQVGPTEQGKAQGCISGICSVANVISPLAFTPLTALFLSESAPVSFPGFGIMCIGLVCMIGFFQSLMIWPKRPTTVSVSVPVSGLY